MTIYLIKECLHFNYGETTEWTNIYAESERENAEKQIERLEEENKRYEDTYHIEYAIEEIQLF